MGDGSKYKKEMGAEGGAGIEKLCVSFSFLSLPFPFSCYSS